MQTQSTKDLVSRYKTKSIHSFLSNLNSNSHAIPSRAYHNLTKPLAIFIAIVLSQTGWTDEPFNSEKGKLLDGRIQWQYAYSDKNFVNTTKESLHLIGFDLALRNVRPDLTNRPILEITPYLNDFAVKVTNLGWGKYVGPEMQLHNSTVLSKCFNHFYTPKLIGELTASGGNGPEGRVLLFPIPDNARVFCFVSYGAIIPSSLEPPLLRLHRNGNSVLSGSDYSLIEKPINVSRTVLTERVTDNGISGRVSFCATLLDKDRTSFDYHVKRLQVVELNDNEALLDTVLGTGIVGCLDTSLQMRFGHDDEDYPAGAANGQTIGITADFRGAEKGRLRVNIPEIALEPNQSQPFSFQFVTDRSMFFHVDVTPRFKENFPALKPERLYRTPANEKEEYFHNIVPRPYSLGMDETKSFISQIVQQRPENIPLSRKILNAALRELENESLNFAQRSQIARHYEQAMVTLLIHGEDINPWLVDYSNWLEKRINNLSDTPAAVELQQNRVLDPYFPLYGNCWHLLCDQRPEVAAKLSVDAWIRGRRELLRVAICFEAVRNAIHTNNRVEVVRQLNSLRDSSIHMMNNDSATQAKFSAWTDLEVLLAGIVRWSDWKFVDGNMEADKAISITWVSCTLSDSNLDSWVNKILKRESNLDDHTLRSVVEVLRQFQNTKHAESIGKLAGSCATSEMDILNLFTFLRYFERIPRNSWPVGIDSFLLNLRDYPHRSEIREIVKEILARRTQS